MVFEIETVYEKGIGIENEDAYLVDEKLQRFAVIDGATGLNKLNGKMATSCLQKGLSAENGSIRDGILEGNRLLQKAVTAHNFDIYELEKSERSTCGFAAIQLQHNRLHYAHSGDCMLFIQYRNGEVRQVTYDHLAKLDSVSIRELRAAISEIELNNAHDSAEEVYKKARNKIKPTIVKNRNLLNTIEGYGVFDGTEEALQYFDFGEIAIQNIQQILLVSDGLQLPNVKVLNSSSWVETASYAFENGLTALLEKVRALENEDPHLMKYPRLKFADDKTGILLKVK